MYGCHIQESLLPLPQSMPRPAWMGSTEPVEDALMINRALIRTRSLQYGYMYFHREDISIDSALLELKESYDETYDLYLHFLQLLPDLTDLHDDRLELARQKHLPLPEDLNPNMRLSYNRLIKKIRESEILQERALHAERNWRTHDEILRRVLLKILALPAYANYLAKEDSYEADRAFWVEAFRQVISVDEDIADLLAQQSIHWDSQLDNLEKIEVEEMPEIEKVEEAVQAAKLSGQLRSVKLSSAPVEIVKDFVDKTIRRIESDKEADSAVMLQYRNEEERTFSVDLLQRTIEYADETSELIDKYVKNWDSDRIADVDMLIMQMALAEMKAFDIPTGVIINEYLDLSKIYSTPNSSVYINGVLDTAAKEVRMKERIK